jgi:hypothetical protein
VEHACYQCGKQVEDGVAFCPNCNAPQIRVAVPDNQPVTQPLRPGTPDEIQPPSRPVSFGYGTAPAQVETSQLNWQKALPGMLLAGLVAGLALIMPPIGYLLWPITGGVLAVVLYKRRMPEAILSSSAGARIGALAGLFGFVLFAISNAIYFVSMGSGKVRELVQQSLQQAAARNPAPEAQAMVQRLMSPEGIALMMAIVFALFMAVFVGFSSIGGAIGAAMTRPKEPKR